MQLQRILSSSSGQWSRAGIDRMGIRPPARDRLQRTIIE